jgi:hypothetical protein
VVLAPEVLPEDPGIPIEADDPDPLEDSQDLTVR